MIAFHELDDALRPALLAASARHFGAHGYQADDRYLDWLYGRNPASRGLRDGIVAVEGGVVVGCMHRLMFPMISGGRLAALHNHFVDPAVRSGSGVLLLRRSTRDVEVAVAPGVEEKLAPIYQRLRFHEIEGAWLQKPLSYLGIATGLARVKLGWGGKGVCRPRRTGDVRVVTAPTEQEVAALCERMRDRKGNAVDWSPDLVRWRYFDPQGPRHILLLSAGSSAYAVVAPGQRKGVRTMRLMDVASDGSPGWIKGVERVARGWGAALGLATTDATTGAQLQRAGWRPRAGKTFTFATTDMLRQLAAPATDLGFEAFHTEFA